MEAQLSRTFRVHQNGSVPVEEEPDGSCHHEGAATALVHVSNTSCYRRAGTPPFSRTRWPLWCLELRGFLPLPQLHSTDHPRVPEGQRLLGSSGLRPCPSMHWALSKDSGLIEQIVVGQLLLMMLELVKGGLDQSDCGAAGGGSPTGPSLPVFNLERGQASQTDTRPPVSL